MAVRLIDVHCDWIRQYAPETNMFDLPERTELAERLEQLSGYMTATSVAFLCCAARNPTGRVSQTLGGHLAT